MEWTADWNASLQEGAKWHNSAAPKTVQAHVAKARYSPYSRSASVDSSDKPKETEVEKAQKLEELRQKVIATSRKRSALKWSASPSGQSPEVEEKQHIDAQSTPKAVDGSTPQKAPEESSRKRKQGDSPSPPTKRLKVSDKASTETEATHPPSAASEDARL